MSRARPPDEDRPGRILNIVSYDEVGATTGHRTGLSWPLLVAASTFLVLLTRGGLLADGDTYWHIAAGRWMFPHFAIPSVDALSYSMAGAQWSAHEWLSEIIFAAAFSIGGWSAVIGVAAAAFASALAILTRYLLRHLEPLYALVFAAMAFSLAAQHLLARPHTLAAPLLVFWTVALLRAREADRAPSLRIVPLMVVWANLHGSFAFGLALGAAFGAEAILEAEGSAARWLATRQWSRFLLAALAASMVNPHGIYALVFAYELSRMDFINRISEWSSTSFEGVEPLEIWLLIAGVAMLTRGLRLRPMRIVLLLGLLHMALHHRRHQDLLGLLAPAIVAKPLAAQWFAVHGKGKQAAALDRWFASLVPPARKAACSMVLACLAAAALVAVRIDALRPPKSMTPDAALAAVRAAYPGGLSPLPGRVLNGYEFSGYLIFSGVAPFIDARGDLYGDAFFFAYQKAIHLERPELLPKLLEKYHVGWTILSPDLPAVALLDRLPGWRRFYADKTAVVHIHDAPN
jgi:hypothetical protein